MFLTALRVCSLTLLTVVTLWGSASGQKLKFGQTFDKATGQLVGANDEFVLTGPQQILAVKFIPRAQLPIDTLFVVVKTIDGVAGRFYMKRNKSKTEANALVRIKAEGIYRVYIYNPYRRSRPVAAGNLFITGPNTKTKAELIEKQRRILIARGVIKDVKPESGPELAKANSDDEDDDIGDLDDDDEGSDGDEDADEEDIEDLDDLLGDDEFFDDDDLMGEFEDLDDLEDDLDIDLEDFN